MCRITPKKKNIPHHTAAESSSIWATTGNSETCSLKINIIIISGIPDVYIEQKLQCGRDRESSSPAFVREKIQCEKTFLNTKQQQQEFQAGGIYSMLEFINFSLDTSCSEPENWKEASLRGTLETRWEARTREFRKLKQKKNIIPRSLMLEQQQSIVKF